MKILKRLFGKQKKEVHVLNTITELPSPKKRKVSQKIAVLNYLKQGHQITPLEALNLFGCFRLADVIYKLRRDGYNIVTHDVNEKGKSYARYQLVK